LSLRIDLDNAAHDKNFDETQFKRDYEAIAKKLPVYCVSSKAYQKISGSLDKDDVVAGFLSLEDTEIPALQRHALGIVQETRASTCRRFLSGLSQFMSSLHLQVVLSDQPLKLADDLRNKEIQVLDQMVADLRKV
jgi:hypothetical protein